MSTYRWSGYRIAPDASDLLVYDMVQSAAPLVNYGSLGTAANMSQSGTGITWGTTGGVYDGYGTVRFPGSGINYLYTADSIAEQAFPITLSVWVHLAAHTPNWGTFVCKNWASATWAAPYKSLYINLNDQGNGSWQCGITFAGAARGWDFGNSDGKLRLDLSVWHHLGMTYDGANMKAYMDGQLVGSLAETRAIDYSQHGRWQLGQGYTLGGGGDQMNGWVSDVRFASVARSAQWFNDVWSKGWNWDGHLLAGQQQGGASGYFDSDKYSRSASWDAFEHLGVGGANYYHSDRYSRTPAFDAESWGMPGPGFMGVTRYYAHRAWRISLSNWHYWNHTAPDPTGFYSGVSPSDLQDITIVRVFTD